MRKDGTTFDAVLTASVQRDGGGSPLLLNGAGEQVDDLGEGDTGYAITAATPFYGEGGGQAGDMGTLASASGEARVLTTHKPAPTLLVHYRRATSLLAQASLSAYQPC